MKKETEAQKTARLRALRLARDKDKPKEPSPFNDEYPDRIYELHSEMRFGKHKGKQIDQIMVDDLGYITWCLENIKGFHLSEHAEAVYLELTDPRRPH